MKLKRYLEVLKQVAEIYGDDLEVVYATDDEGNAFHRVYYTPTAGSFDEDYFVGVDDEAFGELEYEVTSVCVN